MLALLLLLLAAGTAAAAPANSLAVDGIEGAMWHSKFAGHEAAVALDGRQAPAVRLRYDLSRDPGYDWVRVILPKPIDVRPYKYLTVSLRGDGKGAELTAAFIRREQGAGPNNEKTAGAGECHVALGFTGWKTFSIPLSAFDKLGEIAGSVDVINFSLTAGDDPPPASEILIAGLRLEVNATGQVVTPGAAPAGRSRIGIREPAEFFAALDLERPDLAEVRKAVEAKDWPAAKQAWARHLETRTSPHWLWSRKDRDKITRLYEARGGGLARAVPAADRAVARDFDWLGVRKQLTKHIVWLQGPVEWTHVLSRFAYWKDMGYAWWATGKPVYPEDFALMLKDWVADNPVPERPTNSRGANGSVWRTLETGIRGDEWWDVMELFMDAPAFDAEAKYEMSKSLVEHARYLRRFERRFSHGNWQVVECTGLAAVGIMLPECKEAKQWRDTAFHYLVQHMKEDVYPDGAHYEVTPGYHGWVMVQFLRTALLCKANGYDVPGLMDRHERMFEFLMKISKPDRRFPPLGDAGSGGSITDQMGLGALLYNRPDMRFLGSAEASPGWAWLFGPDKVAAYAGLEAKPPDFTTSLLPDAKYGVMRTGWQKDDRYLLFDCAPWGGGHSHQDRLQVICYAGRDLLLDSGQYSYDQPLSGAYFRKGVAHNILLVDGAEQIQANPEVLQWFTSPALDFAAGRISDKTLTHQRSVVFVKPDYWVVVDHVMGQGSHQLDRLFHFPLVEVKADGQSARTLFPDGENVRVLAPDGAALAMRKGWLPTGGATAKEAPVAAFTAKRDLPAALAAVITPFGTEGELPAVQQVPEADPLRVHLVLTLPDGRRDEVLVAPEPADLALGNAKAHARCLLVRQGPAGRVVASDEGR